MEILRFLTSFRRHWVALTVLSVMAGLTGYASTYLLDEKFEAKTTVLVRPEKKISISTSNDTVSTREPAKELLNFPISVADPATETPINTFAKIIQSRVMAERVVEKLGMDKPGPKKPPTTFMERLKDWLDPIKKEIRGYAIDAKNLLYHGRLFDPPSDYDAAIGNYQNFISIEPVKDTHLFEILFSGATPHQAAAVASTTADLFLEYIAEMNTAEYENLLVFLADELAASKAKLDKSREALRLFKEQAETVSFEAETRQMISMISDLETELDRVQASLSGLLRTKLSSSPDVVSLRAEGDYLEKALAGRNEEFNARLTVEAALIALETELEDTEETYQIMRREFEEVRILRSRRISEMRVISYAVAPRLPAKPIRIFYAAAALFVGLLLGAHLVILHELFMGTKIRSVDDVELVLGLPVLATVPKVPEERYIAPIN